MAVGVLVDGMFEDTQKTSVGFGYSWARPSPLWWVWFSGCFGAFNLHI